MIHMYLRKHFKKNNLKELMKTVIEICIYKYKDLSV